MTNNGVKQMDTLDELKQRRATLIKDLKELDNQIQQAEATLKGLKKATIKQRFKQVLGEKDETI
ncbi:hypothetical protein [Streptococcus sp.]|uniref:hypothetical protein n=1 Tax=Streptococcus sp. TaxID=1306 RepID=UPI0029082BF4|nr:hypothetical protein [Streptococcus sp.]MDU6443433.1 hypothetical protein [Streptococcus sp.]MDU6639089.1 hypothetical protein [Streptococcus sp.]